MKPIHTLTWAISAPILLFAGASQAVSISDLTDPGCTGTFFFDSQNNKVSCQASGNQPEVPPSCTLPTTLSATINVQTSIRATCDASPTSYTWTTSSTGAPAIGTTSTNPAPVTFTQAGTYTYTVKATNTAGTGENSNAVTITVGSGGDSVACRPGYVMPLGTTIIRMGGVDNIAGRNFDDVFDNGNKFDSKSEAGQIKALEFTNDAYAFGNIDGTGGNYGSTYKDWSISACPGDFSTDTALLPGKCRKIRSLGVTLTYHASDAAQGCVVPKGQKMYLNIRANDPKLSAGYVLTNSVITRLP